MDVSAVRQEGPGRAGVGLATPRFCLAVSQSGRGGITENLCVLVHTCRVLPTS